MTDLSTALDEMQQRADAATQGPWECSRTTWGQTVEHDDESIFVETYGVTWTPNAADADFIAAARTDVPMLLAAARAVLDLAALLGTVETAVAEAIREQGEPVRIETGYDETASVVTVDPERIAAAVIEAVESDLRTALTSALTGEVGSRG